MIPFRLVPRPGVPVADQVIFAAKKAILGGKLQPGDPFPSVRALARGVKIHPNTAQKVVAQLADEGLLEVLPGIGTVVAQPTAHRGGARLVAPGIERLVVQALQAGLTLEELHSAVDRCWLAVAGMERR